MNILVASPLALGGPSKAIAKSQGPYLIKHRFLPLNPHSVFGEWFAHPLQHFLHHQTPNSIDELQDSFFHFLQPDLSILNCPGQLIDNLATLRYEFL
jgi:hypothetical protein